MCSLAGTLGLGKLVAFYDDNGISIDGEVEGWFTDDTPARFEAYGWHVIPAVDGHNSAEIARAIEAARAETSKPTLICCKTIIGKGSPNKQGKEESHGAALGDAEIALTREALGWPYPPFEIPEEIYEDWNAQDKGKALETAWDEVFEGYAIKYPELAAEFGRRAAGDLPADFAAKADAYIAQCQAESKDVATRKASQLCLSLIHI